MVLVLTTSCTCFLKSMANVVPCCYYYPWNVTFLGVWNVLELTWHKGKQNTQRREKTVMEWQKEEHFHPFLLYWTYISICSYTIFHHLTLIVLQSLDGTTRHLASHNKPLGPLSFNMPHDRIPMPHRNQKLKCKQHSYITLLIIKRWCGNSLDFSFPSFCFVFPPEMITRYC